MNRTSGGSPADKAPSILETTLAAARRDAATVSSGGNPLQRLTAGVTLRDVPTHTDQRGSVVELFDPRWNWHPDPLVFAHACTIRPGVVKGWGLHQQHEDRYLVLLGEMLLVLYDPRPDSATYGEVCEIVLTEKRRRILNIPKLVWHAQQNVGSTDVLLLDFPTEPYNHDNPDKVRLPPDTPLIPYSFGGAPGW
jgi:dTDP-4-dehydrorhamnose 3,5-epimerase